MIPTNQLTLNQSTDSQMVGLQPAAFKGGKRARKSRSTKRSRKDKKRRGGSTKMRGGRKNKTSRK
jgi:hypothetical protein